MRRLHLSPVSLPAFIKVSRALLKMSTSLLLNSPYIYSRHFGVGFNRNTARSHKLCFLVNLVKDSVGEITYNSG